MWKGASGTMKTIEFKQLDETLYYEKLDNGLDVYILPKKAFPKHLLHLQQNTALLIVRLSPLVKRKVSLCQMALLTF